MLLERRFRTTQLSIPKDIVKRLRSKGYTIIVDERIDGYTRYEMVKPGIYDIIYEHRLTILIPSPQHEILVDMILAEFNHAYI